MVPARPFFMGSDGWVRSNAYTWLFSSRHSTTAFSGGFRYSPTTSTSFSSNRGSVDNLNVSTRCGCSPRARQTRCTVSRLTPPPAPPSPAWTSASPPAGPRATSPARSRSPSPPESMAYAPGPHAPRRTGPAPPRRTEPATRAPSPASPPPPQRSAHSAARPPPSAAPAPAAPRDTPPSSTAPAPPTSPADPARSAKHRQLDSSNKPTANTAVYLADTPLAKAALTGPLPAPYGWTKQRPFPH